MHELRIDSCTGRPACHLHFRTGAIPHESHHLFRASCRSALGLRSSTGEQKSSKGDLQDTGRKPEDSSLVHHLDERTWRKNSDAYYRTRIGWVSRCAPTPV